MDKITETHIWAKKTISQKAQLQPSNGYAYAFKSVKKKKKAFASFIFTKTDNPFKANTCNETLKQQNKHIIRHKTSQHTEHIYIYYVVPNPVRLSLNCKTAKTVFASLPLLVF